MGRRSEFVYVFKAALTSPNLAHFHAEGVMTTHTKHTRCGRLAATWPHPGPQEWRAVDLNVVHARAFARG